MAWKETFRTTAARYAVTDMAGIPSPYRIHVRPAAPMVTRPTTSIIALVTNDTTMVERCLRALDRAMVSDDRPEIIVLANGTPTHRLNVLDGRKDVVLITSPINHGFAGGCNLAVRCARGERLVFLNDDTMVTKGWLEGLHRALDADPDTAVAGSKVLLSGGSLQEAGCVLWSDGSTSGVGRGGNPDASEFSFSRPVDYVSFCCAMVRRSSWREAGGLDERYFPAYYEDLDLCLTLRQLGWKVMYEPSSVVHHTEGGSATRHFRDFLSRRNQAAFVAKWGSVLKDYEDPPATEAHRPQAVIRALRRTAHRPVRPRSAETGVHLGRPVVSALDDIESLTLQLRHATAGLAVADEYIRLLHYEVSTRGYRDVMRDRIRIHPLLVQLRGQLRQMSLFRRSGRRSQ